MEFSAKQIAEFLKGKVIGDENASVYTFAKIEEGHEGAISFLANKKYTHYIYGTRSSIVLVNKDFEPEQEVKATLVVVDDAYEALAKLMTLYEMNKPKKNGIDSLAFISADAKIGEDVYIGAFAYIGENVKIGNGTLIYPHAYIGDNVCIGDNCIVYSNVNIYSDCKVGNRCIIHSGAVIGADGFGFAPTPEGYDKIPQIGIVKICDDVEIGANTCIDRSTMGATIINKGVKLDNLIQIAHNDEIGANTVMAAQSGVAGSTSIGEWCMVGGQVGFAGHIKIGDRVKIGAQSGINGNIKPDQNIMGTPATTYSNFMKISVVQRHLPEMYKEVDRLKNELEEIKRLLKK